MRRYRVLVVSDIHVGSIFGLLPPGFVRSDNATVSLNPGQEHLWGCWDDLRQRVRDVDVVVVNGDVIDGPQPAQRGTELSLPILGDQAEAAIETLRLLKKSTGTAPWYFIQGTEYHDCRAGRSAEEVARALDATPYTGLGTGRYSREVLDLDIDGVVINFAHGISVATGFYRATPADREGIWSALAGKDGKMHKADAVVRSHAHSFVHVEHASKHIVISPCWQLQTRYQRKNSVYRMIPDIGAMVLEVTPDAKRQGFDPVHVQKILYPLPAVKPTKLELPSGGSRM